jgi:sec-independent protein translocase protein TatC
MTLLAELRIFVKHILHWFYWFTGCSFFFFAFGIKESILFGRVYYLPEMSKESIAVQFFNKVRVDLLPDNVQLVVTNPMSAFVCQTLVAASLAFMLTFPFFIYGVTRYLNPALLPEEKKALAMSIFPVVLLFFSGCAFSYFFLIPTIFSVLYPFATSIGAMPFFSLDEFVYYVFSLSIAVGIMFLLPLFMILLSMMRIIKASFWKKKWRHAILIFLILSAIITPDGTGVSMIILFLPLAILYFFGYFFAKKLE